MVTNAAPGGGVFNPSAKVHVAGTSEEKTTQSDTLKKQAKAISKILDDTVEISDEARALSEAAKAIKEQAALTATAPDKTTVHAPTNTNAGIPNDPADEYNSKLAELRSKYSEKEAMRRFDEYMISKRFEKVVPGADVYTNGLKESVSTDTSDRFMPSLYTNGLDKAFQANGATGNSDSNYHTHSSITGVIINGKNEYYASTTATYTAEYSDDVMNTIDSVFNRNMSDLQGKVGYDLAEHMKKFSPTGQLSPASVSTDLAAITNNMLRKAGIELGEGQHLTMAVSMDENGNATGLNISGNFDTAKLQDVINKAMADDPGILQAFTKELNSVSSLDVENLNGQYSGADSSVEYVDMGRQFILSGDDPSAMVMADTLGVKSTGYTYQKKVSDSFDPNADSVAVMVPSGSIVDKDANYSAMTKELEQQIADAIKNGTTIDSTITKDEYESNKADIASRMNIGNYAFDPSFYVDPNYVERQMAAVAEGRDPMDVPREEYKSDEVASKTIIAGARSEISKTETWQSALASLMNKFTKSGDFFSIGNHAN